MQFLGDYTLYTVFNHITIQKVQLLSDMFLLPHISNLPELLYLLTDCKLKLSLQKHIVTFSASRAVQQCLAFTTLDNMNSGQKQLHVPWPLRKAFQLFLNIYRPS